MRKAILSIAFAATCATFVGCDYVGMFDSSIKPEVTGEGPREPGGISTDPPLKPAGHAEGANAAAPAEHGK